MLFEASVESGHLLREVDQLLVLMGNECQHGTNKLPYGR
jgi:hypothetical protein